MESEDSECVVRARSVEADLEGEFRKRISLEIFNKASDFTMQVWSSFIEQLNMNFLTRVKVLVELLVFYEPQKLVCS